MEKMCNGLNEDNGILVPEELFVSISKVDNLWELKVIVYAIWFLSAQKSEDSKFITEHRFTGDPSFMEGFGQTTALQLTRFSEGLEKAVKDGFFLHLSTKDDSDNVINLYFFNSIKGRKLKKWVHENGISGRIMNGKEFNTPRKNIFRLYEENLGSLTPMIAEQLQEMENEHSYDDIKSAIAIAVNQNVRTLAYVKGVLKRKTGENKPGKRRKRSYREILIEDGVI